MENNFFARAIDAQLSRRDAKRVVVQVLKPAYRTRNQATIESPRARRRRQLTKVRSVVIFVHGINSGPDAYQDFINMAFSNLWERPLAETKIIQFNWGADEFWTGVTSDQSDTVGGRAQSFTGINDRGWIGVAKLKQVVAQTRDILGFAVPITIVSHSQGTLITLAALQEGMRANHWILMGSPLDKEIVAAGDNNTKLGAAAQNVSGTVLNLWSSTDSAAAAKGGIGAFGLPRGDRGELNVYGYRSNNILESGILGVNHTEGGLIKRFSLGTIIPPSWWGAEWLEDNKAHYWTALSHIIVLCLLRGQKNTTTIDNRQVVRKVDSHTMNRLSTLQNFARAKPQDPSIDNDADSISANFSLTNGMMTGSYFDDKDEAEFQVRCTAGRVKVRLREAVWSVFDKGTRQVSISAGRTYANTYSVDGQYDATLFVEITGAGWKNQVSSCVLDFSARDV